MTNVDDEITAEQTPAIVGIYDSLQAPPPENPSDRAYATVSMIPEGLSNPNYDCKVDDKNANPKKLDPEVYSTLNAISSELQKTLQGLNEPIYELAEAVTSTPKGSVSSEHSISMEVANPLYSPL